MKANEILEKLASGPARGFGSDPETDRELRYLKAQGLIIYRKVKDGGRGWELTAKGESQKGEYVSAR